MPGEEDMTASTSALVLPTSRSSYFDLYRKRTDPPSPLKLSSSKARGKASATSSPTELRAHSSSAKARTKPKRDGLPTAALATSTASSPNTAYAMTAELPATEGEGRDTLYECSVSPRLARRASPPEPTPPESPLSAFRVVTDVPVGTMDALVDGIQSPRSRAGSSRPGRSREPSSMPKPRRRTSNDALEQHHRDLQARLERLAADASQLETDSGGQASKSDRVASPRYDLARHRRRPDSSLPSDDQYTADMLATIDFRESPVTQPRLDIPTIDDIIRAHAATAVHRPARRGASAPPVPTSEQAIPTIDDIVRRHASLVQAASPKRLSAVPRSTSASALRQPMSELANAAGSPGLGFTLSETDEAEPRASIESIEEEVMRALFPPTLPLHHAKSLPSVGRDRPLSSARSESLEDDPGYSICASPTARFLDEPSPTSMSDFASVRPRTAIEVAKYLRSPRLTRLMRLRRGANAGLVVSVADVGAADGHPIIVFLGLGCVRYLVALYDELAEAMGIRLICLDRWGLGRTSAVPDTERGFVQWATVVEEVADQLDVATFGVLAHSAGAPYALATALRLGDRIHGAIHLLAPWVASGLAGDVNAAYKWLRFVPSGVLKSAQAAEWRMQGWKLGKPPAIPLRGVGYDHRAPVSSATLPPPPPARASSEDDGWDTAEHLSQTSLGESETSAGASTPRIEVHDATSSPTSSHSRLKRLFARSNRSSTKLSDPVRTPTYSVGADYASGTSSPRPNSHLSTQSRRSPATSPDAVDLATALLAASHAESLKGGTADLMTILERSGRPMGFSYASVQQPVRVWHGERDERIALASVKQLEQTMPDCRVNAIAGAGHDLMSHTAVMMSVLESLGADW